MHTVEPRAAKGVKTESPEQRGRSTSRRRRFGIFTLSGGLMITGQKNGPELSEPVDPWLSPAGREAVGASSHANAKVSDGEVTEG